MFQFTAKPEEGEAPTSIDPTLSTHPVIPHDLKGAELPRTIGVEKLKSISSAADSDAAAGSAFGKNPHATNRDEHVATVLAAAASLITSVEKEHPKYSSERNAKTFIEVWASKSSELLEMCQQVRKVLSFESNPPIDDVVAAADGGILRVLTETVALTKVSMIDEASIFAAIEDVEGTEEAGRKKEDKEHAEEEAFPGSVQCVFEAAWALTNIASGSNDNVDLLFKCKGVAALILATCTNMTTNLNVVEQGVWAIGNIAGDSIQARDKVIQMGAAVTIAHVIRLHLVDRENQQVFSKSLLCNTAWSASNICRGKPRPNTEVLQTLLVYLSQLTTNCLLSSPPLAEPLTDCLWGMSYASDGSAQDISQVINISETIVEELVECIDATQHEAQVVTPALRTIGNLLTGDDQQTQRVISTPHCLERLAALLEHPKHTIVKETAWALSNVTAGTPDQIRAVLETPKVLPQLIHLARHARPEVAKEAMWAISNASCGAGSSAQSIDLVDYLLTNGVLDLAMEMMEDETPASAVASELLEYLTMNTVYQPNAQNTVVAFARDLYGSETMKHNLGVMSMSIELEGVEGFYDEAVEPFVGFVSGVDDDDDDEWEDED